jgi:hypothetical protein
MALGRIEKMEITGNCTRVHVLDRPIRIFLMGAMESGKTALQKLFLKRDLEKNRISSHKNPVALLDGKKLLLNNRSKDEVAKFLTGVEFMLSHAKAGRKGKLELFKEVSGADLFDEDVWDRDGNPIDFPVDVMVMHIPEERKDIAVEQVLDGEDFAKSQIGFFIKKGGLFKEKEPKDLSPEEKKEFFDRCREGGILFFNLRIPKEFNERDMLRAQGMIIKAITNELKDKGKK